MLGGTWRAPCRQAEASRSCRALCRAELGHHTARSLPQPLASCSRPAHGDPSHRLLGSLLTRPLRGSIRTRTTKNSSGTSAAYVQELLKDDSIPIERAPTRLTTTGRVIAIGDLHGDWRKTVDSFRTAGVINVTEESEIVWTGGDAIVVQLGDVMDRGDHEIAIVKFLRDLDEQARQHGGAVYMLNGNHESLNICGDFRYVTPGAFVESALYAGLSEQDLRDWDLLARVRYAVYRPGGPMAVELSKNPTVLIINDTVFAHGGLLPVHVNYGVEKLNAEVSAWMRADQTADGGKALPPFLAMGDSSSVMWNRTQSKEKFPSQHERYHACSALRQALEMVGSKRLVVGHTPQIGGANCECEGLVWRLDVGMSYGVLNRPVQVLEISRDGNEDILTVLSDAPVSSDSEDNGIVGI